MTVAAQKIAPRKDWNSLIREVISGEWRDPETGKRCAVPFETIRIEETLDGGAADLVGPLNIGRRIAVVSDTNTVEAMGRRVSKELKGWTSVEEMIFPSDTHCNEPTVDIMRDRIRHMDGVVVVGSGSLTDTVRYALTDDPRNFASFATAASMNGYGAGTASVTLSNGYKTSLPAKAPKGVFVDLEVNAAAPTWLAAAGLGDSLCRPVAQVDWWASHRLFGTAYSKTPYDLFYAENDEVEMIRTAPGLKSHSLESNGYLYRVMVEAAFGNNITGSSCPGSMGEHQVSHWIDMFAGDGHPGTIHGQQVGVASVAMARLQRFILDLDKPPRVRPTRIDRIDFETRYGADLGAMMFAQAQKKALDETGARAFNTRLESIWPELRAECEIMLMPADEIAGIMASAGGPTSATELGLSRDLWRKAMKHARDIRNRWSFLDLADDAGLLDEFLLNDPQ